MGKYILVVPSAAKAGREDEYNTWYDTEHLGDVCAVPGFVSGARYDAVASSPDPVPGPCLAIYEIEAEDPVTALTEMRRRAAAGEMSISTSIDGPSAKLWLYQVRSA